VKDVSPKLIVGDRALLGSLECDVPRLLCSEVNAQLPTKPMFAVSDAVNGQTPFQIIFTSGTTAEPKGVVLTHGNVLASLQPIEDEIAKYLKYERWVHPLRFLHSVPLSHVFGQFMGLWTPPLLAAEVHFGEQLEPSRLTELIRREHISVLVVVPRVLHLLRTHLVARYVSLVADLDQAKDLSVWKRWWCFRQVHRALGWKFWAVISGGATLPTDLEDFWSRLGFALIQGYGMTETTALVTLNHPFHIGRERWCSTRREVASAIRRNHLRGDMQRQRPGSKAQCIRARAIGWRPAIWRQRMSLANCGFSAEGVK
jgi:long-chain acyl-CoA synthetase